MIKPLVPNMYRKDLNLSYYNMTTIACMCNCIVGQCFELKTPTLFLMLLPGCLFLGKIP